MKRLSERSRARSVACGGLLVLGAYGLGPACVNVSVGDSATAGESATKSSASEGSASQGTSTGGSATASTTATGSTTASTEESATATATTTATATATTTTETGGVTSTSTTGGDPKIVGLSPDKVLTDDGPDQRVEALALSPDGSKLVAALGGRRIVLFTLVDGAASVVHTLGEGDLFEANAAVWGPKGFAVGTFTSCLLFSDAGSLDHQLADRCSYLGLSEDGGTLVRTTPTSVIAVNAETGETGATASIAGAAGLGLGGSTVYALDSGGVEYVLRSMELPDLSAGEIYPQDVRQLFGGSLRGTLFFKDAKLWTDFAGTPVSLETGALEDQKLLTFTEDGRWTASLGFSGGVHIFDSVSGAHVAEAGLTAKESNGLAFDADVGRLFAGSDSGVQVFTIVME